MITISRKDSRREPFALELNDRFGRSRKWRLREMLIRDRTAVSNHIRGLHRIKEPKTPKEKWLLALVDRAGYSKASVALANKNVRTA